jgi:hypothetical protein
MASKKKYTLVAVLGGCAQLMWLSSGCQISKALVASGRNYTTAK